MQPITFKHYLTHPTEREMDVILSPDDYTVIATIGAISLIKIPVFNYSYVKHKDSARIFTMDICGNLDKQTIFRTDQ